MTTPADPADPTEDPASTPTPRSQPTSSPRAERRRAAQAAERQRARRRWRTVLTTGGVVAAVLLIVIAGIVVVRGRTDAEPPAPAPSPSESGLRQPTLFLQIKDPTGLGAAYALLAVGGPADRGTMLLIPANLYVDVPTGGNMPLADVARLPAPSAAADAVSDLIGVRIDGTLSLDSSALAGLVDAVDGVLVDVDSAVVKEDPDGTQTVLVPTGLQTLSGVQASQYVTHLPTGATEAVRLRHLQQVMDSLVKKLPDQAAQIEPILTSLGSSAPATIPSTQVAQFLARYRAMVLTDSVDYPTLPTVKIETGGSQDAAGVDLDAAAKTVDTYLPDAIRVPGPNSKVRVLVQNGRLIPGLGDRARDLLVDAGFTYVAGGNAAGVVEGPTQIIVPDASPESLQWGQDIATALKLPVGDVRTATQGQSVADVVVVLGQDFPLEKS